VNTVAIVGGGIAGLSIAHAIRQRNPLVRVSVFERGERPGGNIRTEVVDGYVCEWGPDGFLDNVPETLTLARAVGLEPKLRPSSDAARRRFIFRNGRLHEVPLSPLAFVTTSLLSVGGKLRVFAEPFAATRPESDETIFGFAARRIGPEAASVLIDSMVSGIFAGDAKHLSLRACFPKMWKFETDYGSLVRALLATRKRRKKGDAVGAPAGRLTSFDGGMEELPRAIAASLGPSLLVGNRVHEMRVAFSMPLAPRSAIDGYELATTSGIFTADAVVLAGPAAESAILLQNIDAVASGILRQIPTASLAVVCLGYDEQAVARTRGPLNGFGFLVPRSEGVRMLGALWETSIYPNRAPAGKALIRVMIGGALDPRAVELDDGALLDTVKSELAQTMGLSVEPEFVRIVRHPRGIPQYTQGHLSKLQRIDRLMGSHPGIFLAGNSYRGVAINSCIAEAGTVADAVLLHLSKLRRPASMRTSA
jgi:oxygen-dependent protoporphyrinogen oxidase